jgi:hypothetical protein
MSAQAHPSLIWKCPQLWFWRLFACALETAEQAPATVITSSDRRRLFQQRWRERCALLAAV